MRAPPSPPSSLLVALLAIALAAGTAIPAFAAPPERQDDVLFTDKARDLFAEGVALFKKGDYGRARVAHLAAWALKKHWQIATNLGQCELKLGLHRDAAEHLAFGLRDAPKDVDNLEATRKLYEQAKAKVGALEIAVSEPGAEVLVDGAPVGLAPLPDPVFVEPGKHTIEARLDTKRATVEVDAAMGASVPISMVLAAPALPQTPLRNPPPSTPAPGPALAPILLGGAVAAVGLGAGIGLTLAANGKGRDADELAQPGGQSACANEARPAGCADLKDALESLDSFTNAAIAAYIVTGVAAVGTLTYTLWPRTAPGATARGTVVAPWVGLVGGGVAVGGSF